MKKDRSTYSSSHSAQQGSNDRSYNHSNKYGSNLDKGFGGFKKKIDKQDTGTNRHADTLSNDEGFHKPATEFEKSQE
ncbi:MAG: hypothetical protein JRI91_12995 [Deltaproteobacteria bacterium]|nr:hypothetical protein [Deltaproteobacteria bacterium]